jgi:hypothetical protein
MQKGHVLQFDCQGCQTPIQFSVIDSGLRNEILVCSNCNNKYAFMDETLRRQLEKFELLCRQIIDSEEILGSTSVGIDVGEHHIKIPYKLLLTRFNSLLDLKFGDKTISIQFRIEPLKDIEV